MNRRQKIIVSVTGIFLVLLIIVGLTYAYFLTKINGNENTKSISVTTANLALVYGDGNGIISAEKIQPGTTLAKKEFTVSNEGNATTDYVVLLEDVKVTYASTVEVNGETHTAGSATTFESNDFIYTLTCTEGCNGVDNETTFPMNGGILVGNSIEVGVTQTYTLTVTYKETGLDQSNDMNKQLNAKVNIGDISTLNPYNDDTDSLAYNIINSAKSKINGTALSNVPLTTPGKKESQSDEKVLSITQDNYGTSYYYRGSVEDNYVLFNNMCWRIVRIEGDGSIKLAFAGSLITSTTDCYDATEDTARTVEGQAYGYKTVTGLDGKDWYIADYENYSGGIKTELDSWFESNFKSNGSLNSAGKKIKEDIWCLGGSHDYRYNEDTWNLMSNADLENFYLERESDYGYGYYSWHYTAAKRLEKLGSTSLMCGNEEDKFTSKIGLLTSDEVALAGGNDSSSNNTYYLYTAFKYWTLSLGYFRDFDVAYVVFDDGSINWAYGAVRPDLNDGSLYIRPVVTLVSGTQISGGNGTQTNPYTIQ